MSSVRHFEFGDWVFLLTSVFETIMFCGFQTGWSSLVYVFIEEGIYSHLCGNVRLQMNASEDVLTNSSNLVQPLSNAFNETRKIDCTAQQEMLNLAYTISNSVSSIAAFPIGMAMDRIGPRFSRIISGILLGCSCFLMSFLNSENSAILFVGLNVACLATIVLFMTPQACIRRFKKGHSVLIGLYCAGWAGSSFTMLVFKVLHESSGVSIATFFRFLTVCCVFLCINAALLYPDSVTAFSGEKPPLKENKFNKTAFSCFGRGIQKLKYYIALMIKGSSDKINNNYTRQNKDEREQLMVQSTDLNCVQKNTDCGFHSTKHIHDYQSQDLELTKTNSSLSLHPLSQSFTSSITVFENVLEVKQMVDSDYTQKTQIHLKNKCEHNTRQGLAQDVISQKQGGEKHNPSADLQVWTAKSAVAYLKSGLSFKNCVLSRLHILLELFLTVCKLRAWVFVGIFYNFISELCEGDRATVAQYVTIFGLSHIGAFVMAPLFGYLIDRQCSEDDDVVVKPSKDLEKEHQIFMMHVEDTPRVLKFIIRCYRRRIFKLNDAVLVTVSANVVFCLLSLVPSLPVQIITFQLYVFVKVAYDTVFTSILVLLFPQKHLGKLMGLAAFIGAIFSLLQYPLFLAMEEWFDGRTIQIHIFLWVLSLLAFGLPIYLWRKASKQDPNSLAFVNV